MGLLLYRRRHLEYAGDAVAFPILVPVFQVLCSVFVMAGVQVFGDLFGLRWDGWIGYVMLALGLILGWCIAKMLVERSTRIFRLKNFYGLAGLTLAVALSLVGTHFDILGISTRLPDPEKVESVSLESIYTSPFPQGMTDPEDIAAMIELQKLALEDRPEGGTGMYVRGYDESWVHVIDTNDHLYDSTEKNPEFTNVTNIRLIYRLKNGATMTRRYNIWTETGAGIIAREYLSRWEAQNQQIEVEKGVTMGHLEAALEDFQHLTVGGIREKNSVTTKDKEEALSLLDAIKADCEAGTMAQDDYFHKDIFRDPELKTREDGETYYDEMDSISIYVRGLEHSWYISVYPDCENTINWLRERNMLIFEIIPNVCRYWVAYK